MKIAEAYVELRLDSKKAEQEGKAQVTSMGKSLGSTFGQIFGAAAFAAGIADSIGKASELQQAVGATETVFGKAGAAVDKFAKSSADGFGISETAARELTAGIGALLQNMGYTAEQAAVTSVKMAQLGADLAAAFGGKPEDAVEALGSALKGEADPVERFGIKLNDATVKAKAFELGLYSGKGAIDDNAKAQATLAVITEQTAAVQGQATREADTAAGAQARAAAKAEEASAKFGSSILPVYERVTELVGNMADGFAALPAPIQTGVIAMIGLVALSGPIKSVVEVSKSLASIIEKVGASAANMAGGIGNLGLALGAVGLLVSGAIVAYQVYSGRKEEATKRTKDLREALIGEAGAQNEALAALANNDGKVRDFLEAQKNLGVTTAQLTEYVKKGTGPVAELSQAWSDAKAAADGTYPTLQALAEAVGIDVSKSGWDVAAAHVRDFIEQSRDLKKSNDEVVATQALVNEVTGEAAATADEAAAAADKLTDAYDRSAVGTVDAAIETALYAKKRQDATDAVTKAKDAADSLVKSLDNEVTIYDELATAAADLKKAIDSVFGSSLSMEEADRAARAAKDELSKAVKDNGITLDANTTAGRANREQIEASVKSILDYGVAVVGAGGSLDQAAGSVQFMTDNLRTQLEQAGFTKAQIDEYLTTLGLTPENVRTSIELAGNEAAKAELEARQGQLEKLDQGAIAEIQALVDGGKYQEAVNLLDALTQPRSVLFKAIVTGGGPIKAGFASGTNYAPGGLALVGEDPRKGGTGELVNLPRGAQVIPSAQSRSLLNEITSNADRSAAYDIGGDSTVGVTGNVTLHQQNATVVNAYRPVTVDDINRAMAMSRLSMKGPLFTVGDINGGDWLKRLVDAKLGELVAAIQAGPTRHR